MSLFEISQRPFLQGNRIATVLAGSICIPLDAFLPESASTRRRVMLNKFVDTRQFSERFFSGF